MSRTKSQGSVDGLQGRQGTTITSLKSRRCSREDRGECQTRMPRAVKARKFPRTPNNLITGSFQEILRPMISESLSDLFGVHVSVARERS
jgi:hypothetical protein